MVAAKAKALGLDTLAQSVSIGYVIVFLIVLALVLVLNKTTKAKLIGGIVTVGAFALLPYWLFVHKSPAQLKAIDEQAEFMARYEPAKALFEKLCKEQAGEKIYRTVENVEGILLLKVRPETNWDYQNDPNWPEAALPSFARTGTEHNKGLAEQLLWDWYWDTKTVDSPTETISIWQYRSSVGAPAFNDPNIRGMRPLFRGYRFVDVLDADGIKRSRVTARLTSDRPSSLSSESEFQYQSTQKTAPRYGVTFEDNLDPALRQHWIAGSTVKVVDTETNAVIGQQTFWVWDRGFGAKAQVGPWSTNAFRCPLQSNPMTLIHSTLKSKQGN